jgi:hypothetical protein
VKDADSKLSKKQVMDQSPSKTKVSTTKSSINEKTPARIVKAKAPDEQNRSKASVRTNNFNSTNLKMSEKTTKKSTPKTKSNKGSIVKQNTPKTASFSPN